MKIQIVGTGCSRCRALAAAAEKAAQSLGLNYELEKVTDLEHMIGLGVMATPALAVDGVVRFMGRVPGFEELKQLLEEAQKEELVRPGGRIKMSKLTVGFIGGGRVTGIFLEGWERAQKMPAEVVVSDCNPEALAKLHQRFTGIEVAPGEAALAAGEDVVFLAVHPPVMAEVAAGIKGSLKAEAMVVSLAPKIRMAKLTELLGGFARIARVIPNAPSVVNFGFNPVTFGPALNAADREEITALLSPLGECPEVAEAKLEGYALLSGMGPTYLWFQLQALREVASGFGLSEAEIGTALKRMVCGSARTLLESGHTPTEVMDLVPVKPLAEMEGQVTEMYRTRLPALFEKIRA